MKILSWNIMQGGGARLPRILDAIDRHEADTLVLGEVSAPRLRELTDGLESRRYRVAAPSLQGRQRGVLVASRRSFEQTDPSGGEDVPRRLWSEVRFSKPSFTLTGLHVPDRPRDIRGFWPWIHRAADRRRGQAYLFVGDLNSGTAAFDAESGWLTGDSWFSAMPHLGFTDLWRYKHRCQIEYTWYSRASNGRRNGFRLDHAFASKSFRRRVQSCHYSHAEREAGLSDHSLLLLTVK